MLDKRRVLVIDDDPLFRQTTAAILQAQGFQVDTATSASEGRLKMESNAPDAVILDVMMEWILDGVALSRDMLRSPFLRRIPIIMCSSICTSEYLGYFPQDEYLHIDEWLDKPVSPDALVAAIERSLDRRGLL